MESVLLRINDKGIAGGEQFLKTDIVNNLILPKRKASDRLYLVYSD